MISSNDGNFHRKASMGQLSRKRSQPIIHEERAVRPTPYKNQSKLPKIKKRTEASPQQSSVESSKSPPPIRTIQRGPSLSTFTVALNKDMQGKFNDSRNDLREEDGPDIDLKQQL